MLQVDEGGIQERRRLPRLIWRNSGNSKNKMRTHRFHVPSGVTTTDHNNRGSRKIEQDSHKVRENTNSHRKVSTKSKRGGQSVGTSDKLVYLDRSPNFCRTSRWWAGTSGRECQEGMGCEKLCCGRGHHSAQTSLAESCRCRVVWCCSVECHTCTTLIYTHTCK